MDVALVEDAEHDIDASVAPPGSARAGCRATAWKARAVPWKVPWIVAGMPMRAHGVVDSLTASESALSDRQVEGDRAGDELALVVDGERRGGRLVMGEGRQRDHRLGGSADGVASVVDVPSRRCRRSRSSRWCAVAQRRRSHPLVEPVVLPAVVTVERLP